MTESNNMINSKVSEEYQNLAEQYDSKYEHYNARTISETVFSLDNIDNKSILDVGCGTGILLSLLSRLNGTTNLFGIDLTPGMLNIAEKRLGTAATLLSASSENIPLTTNSIDVVISTNCFHYFSNQKLAINEFRRVLKPGGQLIITDWCHDYIACKACDLYLKLIGKGHFNMLSSTACHCLLKQENFIDIQIKKFKINWIWGMMTVIASKPE